LLALVVYPKRWKEWIFVGLLIGYFTVLNNIFFAYPRYNQPLLPFLFVFASAGVIGVIQRVREYILNKNPAR
jgi:formate-dependent nitrite reductase membrane component NrfD